MSSVRANPLKLMLAEVADKYIRENFQRISDYLTNQLGFPTGFRGHTYAPTAPNGWLVADGTAVSRTQYAGLYATIGVTFGKGDGTTTFNLPDDRGLVLVGSGKGTAISGLTNKTLGSAGGEESHVLSNPEMPYHNHTGGTGTDSVNHTHAQNVSANFGSGGSGVRVDWNADGTGASSYAQGIQTDGVSQYHTHSIPYDGGSAGATVAHNNLQPYRAALPIIKY